MWLKNQENKRLISQDLHFLKQDLFTALLSSNIDSPDPSKPQHNQAEDQDLPKHFENISQLKIQEKDNKFFSFPNNSILC